MTNADFRSHCVMQRGLQRIFPKLKIISEEDSESVKCSDVPLFDLDPTVLHDSANVPDEIVPVDDVTVWLDPLDATQEYTGKWVLRHHVLSALRTRVYSFNGIYEIFLDLQIS